MGTALVDQDGHVAQVTPEGRLKVEASPVAGSDDGLTDAELRATPVVTSNPNIPDLTGAWGYSAGSAGTVSLVGDKRVVGIAAVSVAGGSMTINGGDSIPLPANLPIAFTPTAQLVDPTIIFTSTDSFVVEHVT